MNAAIKQARKGRFLRITSTTIKSSLVK